MTRKSCSSHLLPPTSTHQTEPTAESPALILASGPRPVPALGRPEQGQVCPAFTTVVKPQPSGITWPLSARLLPSSDPEEASHVPPRPPSPQLPGESAGRDAEDGQGSWPHSLPAGSRVGGGRVPCSVYSVTFVKCEESLNSCIFKEKILFNPLCSRLTYT